MPRTGPRRKRPTKFVADAMLGSFARKLRALGFDTAYYRDGDDAGILKAASRGRRVILTADRSLAERAKALGTRALLVTGATDGRRLASLVLLSSSVGLALSRGGSRCSVCNGRLVVLPRAEVGGKVPPAVGRRHRLFYRCVKCGRLYWRGSHWKKLRWLGRILA